jgi:hypothetical protein
MSRYETPHYARLFRSEAQNKADETKKQEDEKKHLRETLTKLIKAFEGDIESQEKILQVVYEQGHDGHLLRRLTNAMKNREN